MGWMTRFEPATSGSTDRRSNQLSYIHHKSSIVIILIFGRFCQKKLSAALLQTRPNQQTTPYKICRRQTQKTKQARKLSQALTQTPPGAPFQAFTPIPPGAGVPQSHANPPGAGVLQGRAPSPHIPPGARSARARHANTAGRCPIYLAGAAVCGAGKWRRLWRT